MKVAVTFAPVIPPCVVLDLPEELGKEYIRLYNLIYLSQPAGNYPDGTRERYDELCEQIAKLAHARLATPVQVLWSWDDIEHKEVR